MSSDTKPSAAAVPSGTYSTAAEHYSANVATTTSDAASAPADAVRVVAVAERITVTYDSHEQATRRMIRRINES
jgi:hypothetical protein